MQMEASTRKRRAAAAHPSVSAYFKHTKRSPSSSPPFPTSKPAPPKPVSVGSFKLIPGVDLLPLPDSTALHQARDYRALFTRLDTDGVILVRGVVSPDTISGARQRVLRHLASKGAIVPSADPNEATISRVESGARVRGWTVDADSGGVNGDREDESAVAGWREVGTSTEVLNVYDGPELHAFFHGLFTAGHSLQAGGVDGAGVSQPFTTFPDCTWLRIRGHGDDTTEHADYYYFKRERSIFSDHFVHPGAPLPAPSACTVCHSPAHPARTLLCDLCDHPIHTYCHSPPLPSPPHGEFHCASCANLPFPFYTAWIALGPVHQQHGRLALVPGSHRLQGYEATAKGDGKLPREWMAGKAGAARGRVWWSADMEGGDVLLFNMKTVHAASVNESERFRISMDTRVTMAQGQGWTRRIQREAEEARTRR